MAISTNKSKIVQKRVSVPVGKYEFQCNKCKTIHKESAYCIAQRAMGHKIIFTCDCKNKITLKAY